MFPEHRSREVPSVSAQQMAQLDRLMVSEAGITLAQMMENAGRALAILTREYFLDGDAQGRRVTVVVGSGGNGGGGMVAARHLANWGCEVRVFLGGSRERLKPVSGLQARILEQMAIPLDAEGGLANTPRADVILDALIGYSLSGPPRGRPRDLIEELNRGGSGVLSLDLPSGLDATSGEVASPTVRADATLTLALPKTGLLAPQAQAHVGDLYLADISVPPSLYRSFGLELEVPALFRDGDILRLI